MAYYRCLEGNAAPGPAINKIKYFSGKIDNQTGTIIEDASYFYTEWIPWADGAFIFDLGMSGTINGNAVTVYQEDKTYIDYWTTSTRFRTINGHANYASGGRWCRISGQLSHLGDLLLWDKVNNFIYFAATPYQVSND